jgi:hypothetical protein
MSNVLEGRGRLNGGGDVLLAQGWCPTTKANILSFIKGWLALQHCMRLKPRLSAILHTGLQRSSDSQQTAKAEACWAADAAAIGHSATANQAAAGQAATLEQQL